MRLRKLAESAKVEDAKRVLDTSRVGEFKKLLRPGDLLFTSPDRKREGGFLGNVFKPLSRAVQGTDYGHVAVYVGDGKVVESRIVEGVTKKTLTDVVRANNVVAGRVKGSQKEREKAARYAEEQVGKPYDALRLLAAALPFRGKHEGVSPEKAKELQCAALIANAYARKKFGEGSRLTLRPSEILESEHVSPLGALTRFNKTATTVPGNSPRKLVLPK